jgi:hypothetical protein
VAEHDAAQRPCDEADSKGRKGRQRADQWIEGRKEQAVEDQRGSDAVHKEVVELDRRADEAGRGNPGDG